MSARPLTSSMVASPWVILPTLQLPWSSGAVVKVRSVPFIQKTQPAGTLSHEHASVGQPAQPGRLLRHLHDRLRRAVGRHRDHPVFVLVAEEEPAVVKKWKSKGTILSLAASEAVNVGIASGLPREYDELYLGLGIAPATIDMSRMGEIINSGTQRK